jgi:hypothetical protein
MEVAIVCCLLAHTTHDALATQYRILDTRS